MPAGAVAVGMIDGIDHGFVDGEFEIAGEFKGQRRAAAQRTSGVRSAVAFSVLAGCCRRRAGSASSATSLGEGISWPLHGSSPLVVSNAPRIPAHEREYATRGPGRRADATARRRGVLGSVEDAELRLEAEHPQHAPDRSLGDQPQAGRPPGVQPGIDQNGERGRGEERGLAQIQHQHRRHFGEGPLQRVL